MRCRNCKAESPDGFGFRVQKEKQVPFVKCASCRATLSARIKKYRNTDKGKAASARQNARPEVKAMKASLWKRKGPEYLRKYRKSEKGKATMKRNAKTPMARAGQQRRSKRANEKIAADPLKRLDRQLRLKAGKMLHGNVLSGTVAQHTDFKTPGDLGAHLKELFEPGMRLDNYGEWDIGHKFARVYCSTTVEDITRCWKKINVFPQWHQENMDAGVQLPGDNELLALMPMWPAWFASRFVNRLPTHEERVVIEKWGVQKGDKAENPFA